MSGNDDAAAAARVFHYSDETSHKFWSLTVDGAAHDVRFGRIGTDGQAQRKTFDNEAAARDAADRLIAAKLRKGYREITPDEAARVAPRRRPPAAAKRRPVYEQLLLPF